MNSRRSSPLPKVFRAAAFYVFFSVFFLNAQPFLSDWNNPFSHFLQRMYSYFQATETTVSAGRQANKADAGLEPCGVYPDPPPPPPPPSHGAKQLE